MASNLNLFYTFRLKIHQSTLLFESVANGAKIKKKKKIARKKREMNSNITQRVTPASFMLPEFETRFFITERSCAMLVCAMHEIISLFYMRAVFWLCVFFFLKPHFAHDYFFTIVRELLHKIFAAFFLVFPSKLTLRLCASVHICVLYTFMCEIIIIIILFFFLVLSNTCCIYNFRYLLYDQLHHFRWQMHRPNTPIHT